MQCAYCGRPIDPKSTWKGAANRLFCSEFCADSETAEPVAASPTLLELHRNRPYERLERLLPYMRRYSGQALAAARARTLQAKSA